MVKKVNGIFCFKVKNGPGGKDGTWIVDVKNGNGSVKFDPQGIHYYDLFSMMSFIKATLNSYFSTKNKDKLIEVEKI